MNEFPDRPFLNDAFGGDGGGIDFLGVRAVNLRMLQEYLIPGINNATSDFGTYCLATWIPWKFARLVDGRERVDADEFRRFREAIEVAVSHVQRDGSPANVQFGVPRLRIGVQQKVESPSSLSFKASRRTNATSVYAAPLYGPSLKFLDLIAGTAEAADGSPTSIHVVAEDEATGTLIAEVDHALRRSKAYFAIDTIDIRPASLSDLDDLGLSGLHPTYYRGANAGAKHAFLKKLFFPDEKRDDATARLQTAQLICETVRKRESTIEELRRTWHTGLLPTRAPLELSPELRGQAARWAVFQDRQIQRSILEAFLRCLELVLRQKPSGVSSVREIINWWRDRNGEAFSIEAFGTLEDLVKAEAQPVAPDGDSLDAARGRWRSTVHGAHPLYEDIPPGPESGEFGRACRMLARWWLRAGGHANEPFVEEFVTMGGPGRISLRWFVDWLNVRLGSPLEVVLEEIFSELVFAQHIKVALARFDGEVQRLRFTLGDSGIVPTVGTKKLGAKPVRMVDRLYAFLGLLTDVEVLENEDGVLRLGPNSSLVLA